MKKPKVNQKKAYSELGKRLDRYVAKVQSVYDELCLQTARIAEITTYDGGVPFSFSDYPEVSMLVEDLKTEFVQQMQGIVYSGISSEWKQSNIMQDLLAKKVMRYYDAQIDGEIERVYFQTNSDAMIAFQNRVDNGLHLSDKLWNQSDNYVREMEFAISSAIEKGMSAVTLSKRISQYLNDFDSLKDDYGEKYGHAVDCSDCEYRSIRLARSEINMAYRAAEQERWRQFDFITGYEIKLSGSHPKDDICDTMVGIYPKDFVFSGWHPNCMCMCLPVIMEEEDYWEMRENGNVESKQVTEMPAGFKEYVIDNYSRIETAMERGTLPYWAKDNYGAIVKIREDLFIEREDLYNTLADSPEYTGVFFDRKTLGLMATHKEHNFDKVGGVYEKEVQKAGYKYGHSVILEKEDGSVIGKRNTEGTWDGLEFEVAGRETATENNILRGLKHCASKVSTEVAVLDFPNGGFNAVTLSRAVARYKGLEKLKDGQFVRFKKIVCVEDGKIVYDKNF